MIAGLNQTLSSCTHLGLSYIL